MLKFLPYLVVVLAFFFIPFNAWGSEEVLYWMVDDRATVDGGSIVDFVESYGMYEEEYNGGIYTAYNVAARVKVTSGDGSGLYYLPIYFGEGLTEDGEFGVDFSPNLGGSWGSGVPTGNQSSLNDLNYSLFAEYVFQVELGEITWDDVAENYDWVTLAKSDEFAASSLNDYIHESFDLYPSSLQVWTPMTFHTIPEPNSFILLSIGISMLLLSRKRA